MPVVALRYRYVQGVASRGSEDQTRCYVEVIIIREMFHVLSCHVWRLFLPRPPVAAFFCLETWRNFGCFPPRRRCASRTSLGQVCCTDAIRGGDEGQREKGGKKEKEKEKQKDHLIKNVDKERRKKTKREREDGGKEGRMTTWGHTRGHSPLTRSLSLVTSNCPTICLFTSLLRLFERDLCLPCSIWFRAWRN